MEEPNAKRALFKIHHLYELKQEASLLGADAVVAVDLDYVQIGDGGWSMVMLVASGTAVKIEKPAAA
ncbi:heavy metal-binding domain-containing protein [Sulfitobacter sp. SK025]|uniref:heavy metal-binding domain-containing protein n=1 Tax=Sulfitobacter sp. SK025 TaxID=1389011 RepID=UPI0034A0B358